jgi:flavin reductase (DIM6/NTAB) family NADH-FMN oxidoreductase RutF
MLAHMVPHAAVAALRRQRAWATTRALANRAAPAGADRFGRGGVPLAQRRPRHPRCQILAERPTGDHWIIIGRVDDLRTSPTNDPLVFFAGVFGTRQ